MSNVKSLSLVRLLTRLRDFKKEIVPVKTKMEELNKQMQTNIDNQKVINKHLAERNAAWRKLEEKQSSVASTERSSSEPKEKVKLCLVK